MKLLSIPACLFFCFAYVNSSKAQPYIDPLNIRYTHAFNRNNGNAVPYDHIFIGSDLPVRFKSGTILLLSPFYENWNIDSGDNKTYLPSVKSFAIPVSIIFSVNKKWSLNVTAISRINHEDLDLDSGFQIGGLAFASLKLAEQKKVRFGLYVNNDFFGLFIIPLVGVDWRIDKNNYLFGLLPGRLTFEHKVNNILYSGATFHAITNSYRFNDGRYLRIDDNQLSLYVDYYPAKHIALTLEPGYGIFRKLRSGYEHNKNYIQDYNWSDGFFINLSASYRIRLQNDSNNN
jgi:hypothetical protein